jgi:hypothetical protein
METQTPLWERAMLSMKLAVYPDRIVYKPSMFAGEVSVPIEKVASVEISGAFSSTVDVVLVSGERKTYTPMLKNKQAFAEAIYKAKEMLRV